MHRLVIALLGLTVAALVPAAARAQQTAAPSLSFTSSTGNQFTILGSGWPANQSVTFSVTKGPMQSILLQPDADGTFEVAVNHVNICGITFFQAHDGSGDQAHVNTPGIMCMKNYTPPPPGTATLTVLKGQSATPKQLVAAYFADLDAHSFQDARALEATCSATLTMQSGHGKTTVTLAGTAPASGDAALKSFVRSSHLTSIQRLHSSLLSKHHFAGFRVGGTFQIDYAQAVGGAAITKRLKSGHAQLGVIARRCGGQWEVDPNWTAPNALLASLAR